jgi:transcriptional regulator
MTVQAKATLQFYDDIQTSNFLKELTHHYEDPQTQPELMENMTEGYIKSSLTAIVGFEAQLTDLRATFKLSQNRDDESYMKIITALEATNLSQEKSIAEEMKERRPHLFIK